MQFVEQRVQFGIESVDGFFPAEGFRKHVPLDVCEMLVIFGNDVIQDDVENRVVFVRKCFAVLFVARKMLIFCVGDVVCFYILGGLACVVQACYFCRNCLDFVFVLAYLVIHGKTVLQNVIENFAMASMRLDASD